MTIKIPEIVKQYTTHKVIWPSLGTLAVIIPAMFWLYGHFAKASELNASECRMAIVVNELTQNVAVIDADNQIKKLKRKLTQYELIPIDSRTPDVIEDIDTTRDDILFYKGMVKEITLALERIATRQIKDPCKGDTNE